MGGSALGVVARPAEATTEDVPHRHEVLCYMSECWGGPRT